MGELLRFPESTKIEPLYGKSMFTQAAENIVTGGKRLAHIIEHRFRPGGHMILGSGLANIGVGIGTAILSEDRTLRIAGVLTSAIGGYILSLGHPYIMAEDSSIVSIDTLRKTATKN